MASTSRPVFQYTPTLPESYADHVIVDGPEGNRAGSWRAWNLRTWNEQLLFHYFQRRDENASPVIILLATADELARATGDRNANADDARNAFVESVRIGIRRSKSLLDDASDYETWPGPPRPEAMPRFVAHLLFTCIAASESSDELGDERKFLSRLRELTHDQLPEHTIERLPRLWANLASWLKSNRREYRSLNLPDPGTFTRIGHTIRLAFPDRRDQRQLSDIIDRAGLAGHEPPVGRVISLVASERSRFRNSFLMAFDEFRRLFESIASHFAPTLVGHRFWVAVRDASLRGRGQVGLIDLSTRVSLLCEEQDGRLALFVAAETSADGSDFASMPLPVSCGEWRFALVPRGTETLDAAQLEIVSQATLAGKLRFPRISNYVEQGVLPFISGSHGLLELAAAEELDDVTVALVRDRVLKDFLKFFGQGAFTEASSYAGWVQVHGPRLRAVPSADLDGTSLARAWILQELLVPTSIRIAGGVRADDGWLGIHEALPRVVAPGASAVILEGPEGSAMLNKVDGEQWELPCRDLRGEFVLLALSDGDEQDRRTIRFHETPASEAFKQPSELDAWITEGLGGTVTLSATAPYTSTPREDDCQKYAERVALLGATVGQFVTDSQEAVWRLARFGGKLVGSRGPRHKDAPLPCSEINDAHARRRWRKLLFDCTPSWVDPEFDRARRAVKATASSHASLAKVDGTTSDAAVPDLSSLPLPPPVDAADRLVRILASRASMRVGLAWHDWAELAQRVLGIDEHQLGPVTQAWIDAGLIDLARYARWRHRAIFARKPRLIGFRLDNYTGATLTGLTLPTTRAELRQAALRMNAVAEERFSCSVLVPGSLALRLRSPRHLDELGAACKIGVSWLDFESMSSGLIVRHDGTTEPPSNYESVRRWAHWSLASDCSADLEFEHHMRRDRPDYWVVSHGARRIWSYELNVVRAWAASLLGVPVVNPNLDAFIEPNHAYLPLPLARVVSILGAGLPGPTSNGSYLYPIGFPDLRDRVLDIVARTFDPSRLAALAAGPSAG